MSKMVLVVELVTKNMAEVTTEEGGAGTKAGSRCRDWYVSVGGSFIFPTFLESPSTLISSPMYP